MFKAHSVTDRSLATRLSQMFVVVTIVISFMLAMAAIAFVVILGHFEPTINGLVKGSDAVGLIHSGMLDEETGLRGYLDSGDLSYLAPYTSGAKEIAAGDAGSIALVSRADLAIPMLDMRVAERVWLDEWAKPALTTPPSGANAAQRADLMLSGKELFDTFRAAYTAVDDRIAAAVASEQKAEHAFTVAFLGLAGVVLIAMMLAARRQRRRLSAALIDPIDDLLSTMRRVSQGEFDARPAIAGPPELRELSVSLGNMIEAGIAERSRIATLEGHARSEAARLQLIVGVGREIAGSLSLRYVSEAVAHAAVAITGYPTARIWLRDEDGETMTCVHDSELERGVRADREAIRLGEGLVGRAGQYGRAMSTRPDGSVATEHRGNLPTSGLAVPMIVAARVVGVLELATDEPRDIDQATLDIMLSLGGQAATAIEAARLHQRDDEMSHTDALTALPNRRRLQTDLDAEVARSSRYQRPLAFIMLDIDHFKRFNDTHGHQVGDEILAEFSRALEDAIRETDTAYRYGGEEFCVLLRETDSAAAAIIAERLRATIQDRFLATNGSRGVTASLGVAGLPEDATDAKSLIAASDRALYAAKAAGRNCVVPASQLPAAPVPRVRAVVSVERASA